MSEAPQTEVQRVLLEILPHKVNGVGCYSNTQSTPGENGMKNEAPAIAAQGLVIWYWDYERGERNEQYD
ncbi:MAG: hypothetical protein OXI16_13700 [Chloroflexota bacterium]|nr:hypothetical protein [Chloroflexota bacterium]